MRCEYFLRGWPANYLLHMLQITTLSMSYAVAYKSSATSTTYAVNDTIESTQVSQYQKGSAHTVVNFNPNQVLVDKCVHLRDEMKTAEPVAAQLHPLLLLLMTTYFLTYTYVCSQCHRTFLTNIFRKDIKKLLSQFEHYADKVLKVKIRLQYNKSTTTTTAAIIRPLSTHGQGDLSFYVNRLRTPPHHPQPSSASQPITTAVRHAPQIPPDSLASHLATS